MMVVDGDCGGDGDGDVVGGGDGNDGVGDIVCPNGCFAFIEREDDAAESL